MGTERHIDPTDPLYGERGCPRLISPDVVTRVTVETAQRFEELISKDARGEPIDGLRVYPDTYRPLGLASFDRNLGMRRGMRSPAVKTFYAVDREDCSTELVGRVNCYNLSFAIKPEAVIYPSRIDSKFVDKKVLARELLDRHSWLDFNYLGDLYVLSSYRRQGFGKKLVEDVARHILSRKHEFLVTITENSQLASHFDRQGNIELCSGYHPWALRTDVFLPQRIAEAKKRFALHSLWLNNDKPISGIRLISCSGELVAVMMTETNLSFQYSQSLIITAPGFNNLDDWDLLLHLAYKQGSFANLFPTDYFQLGMPAREGPSYRMEMDHEGNWLPNTEFKTYAIFNPDHV